MAVGVVVVKRGGRVGGETGELAMGARGREEEVPLLFACPKGERSGRGGHVIVVVVVVGKCGGGRRGKHKRRGLGFVRTKAKQKHHGKNQPNTMIIVQLELARCQGGEGGGGIVTTTS